MKYLYKNRVTLAEFRLSLQETEFYRVFYGKDRSDKLLTIAWNRGETQKVKIDGILFDFPPNTIVCLMVNQSFNFSEPESVTAWQFNKDFYCIENHDKEVSCVEFLFYGSGPTMSIKLNKKDGNRIASLLDVFEEEFETCDNIQEDMLRMLLKRLIILVTRTAKQQFTDKTLTDSKLNLVRNFNLLVEHHYKEEHRVSFYAAQLNRSAKTLSNVFAIYNQKSPLAVIQERIFLEAKRLLVYTDKSSKEIAYELGFEDTAYFSNFFKKLATVGPREFRKNRDQFLAPQAK